MSLEDQPTAFPHESNHPDRQDEKESGERNEPSEIPNDEEDSSNFFTDEVTAEDDQGLESYSLVEKFHIDKFYDEFNISQEELESVPGFTDLSAGQKKLALDNFRKLTLSRIKEEGIKSYREDVAESGKYARMWKGFLSSYYKAKSESLQGERLLRGGIDIHREALADVVEKTKWSELDIDENGELIFAQKFEGMTPEYEKIVEEFNKVAQEFANTSSNWRYEDWLTENVTGSERDKYYKIQERYRIALRNYVDAAARHEPIGAIAALAADKRVRLTQFFATDKNYEDALQNIKNEPKWYRVLNNVVAEKGGYVALGVVGRTVASGVLGLVGAPLVAAGLGGGRARSKARESLEEEALLRRGGDKNGDAEEEMLNVVSADSLTERLNRLIKDLDDPSLGEKERVKLLNKLNRRIEFTKLKLEASEHGGGLIDYGDANTRTSSSYALLQAFYLAQAHNTIHQDPDVRDDVLSRLDRYLDYKDDKVRKYVHKKTLMGAGISAGFAGLGAAIAGWFSGDEVSDAAQPVSEKTPETGGIIPNDDLANTPADNMNAAGEESIAPEDLGADSVDVLPETEDSIISESADGTDSSLEADSVLDFEVNIITKDDYVAKSAQQMVGGSIEVGGETVEITEDLIQEAFANPESTHTLPDGTTVPIRELHLVHEGDVLELHIGDDGKPCFDFETSSSQSPGDLRDLYEAQKRSGGATDWVENNMRRRGMEVNLAQPSETIVGKTGVDAGIEEIDVNNPDISQHYQTIANANSSAEEASEALKNIKDATDNAGANMDNLREVRLEDLDEELARSEVELTQQESVTGDSSTDKSADTSPETAFTSGEVLSNLSDEEMSEYISSQAPELNFYPQKLTSEWFGSPENFNLPTAVSREELAALHEYMSAHHADGSLTELINGMQENAPKELQTLSQISSEATKHYTMGIDELPSGISQEDIATVNNYINEQAEEVAARAEYLQAVSEAEAAEAADGSSADTRSTGERVQDGVEKANDTADGVEDLSETAKDIKDTIEDLFD